MDILLQKFASLGRISARSTEFVKKQYQKFFIVIDQNLELFSSFNPTNDRVDTFFQKQWDGQMNMEIFGNSLKCFWFCFMVQSEVERGFSVNKQLFVENLETKSLVALRSIAYDINFSELSLDTIKNSKELIKSIKEAHRRHQDELEKQIKQKQESQKSLKHKNYAGKINALKEKRVTLLFEIEMLRVYAGLLAVKAEKFYDFCYHTKSNQQKKLADEKHKEK